MQTVEHGNNVTFEDSMYTKRMLFFSSMKSMKRCQQHVKNHKKAATCALATTICYLYVTLTCDILPS